MVETLQTANAVSVITAHAPVLLIPELFDRDYCRRLIEFWGASDRFTGGVSGTPGGADVIV